MDYHEFQRYMANYGFVSTPITEEEYARCAGLDDNVTYGIACDVNAGIPFEEAYRINACRQLVE